MGNIFHSPNSSTEDSTGDKFSTLLSRFRRGDRDAANKLFADHVEDLKASLHELKAVPPAGEEQKGSRSTIPAPPLTHTATIHGWADIVLQLLDVGYDLNEIDRRGDTCLSLACTWNHEELAMKLLERGAKVDIENENKNIALYGACRRGMINVVQCLLDRGLINPVHINKNRETLLHCCLYSALQEDDGPTLQRIHTILTLFLNLPGIKINAKDIQGNTPLHVACQLRSKGTSTIIELLVKNGSNASLCNEKGNTPFLMTYQHPKSFEAMETLIRLNIPIEKPSKSKYGLDLHMEWYDILKCAAETNTFVAQKLIDSLTPHTGCLRKQQQYTYLHHACDRYDLPLIKLLIDSNFDLYACIYDGSNVIHIAAGYLQTLTHIVNHCKLNNTVLDTSIGNHANQIPLHCVGLRYRNSKDTFEEILKIHLAYGGDVNAIDVHGCTPFHYACEKGHEAWELHIWLNYGARVDIENKVCFIYDNYLSVR